MLGLRSSAVGTNDLALAISALGLLMIYDASHGETTRLGLSRMYFVERQGIAIGLGLIAMIVVIRRESVPARGSMETFVMRMSGRCCQPSARSKIA